MQKTYNIGDYSFFNRRVLRDFNLYGANLNIKKNKEIDEIKEYGRTKRDHLNISKK